jgi:hypothetical protein
VAVRAPSLTQRFTRALDFCRCGPQQDIPCWPERPCRDWYVTGQASFIPNVGLGLGAGRVIAQSGFQTLSAEAIGTWQFIDDETFIDDGNPAAGDLYQLRAGFKGVFSPDKRRHWVVRAGGVWFEAGGEPNIVDVPGSYYGVYGSAGIETDVSSCLTMGPEVALLLVTPEGEFSPEPVPQVNFNVTYWPGGTRSPAGLAQRVGRPPRGEFYVGAAATLAPGVGPGFTAGMVIQRTRVATISFEGMAALQDGGDFLGFEGQGNWGQLRGGFKGTFQPCCNSHLTARAGLCWLRSTAPTDVLDNPGDHFGAYLGLGYEWDISRRLTTGPEVSLMAVTSENTDFSPQAVPQFHWHFTVKL